MTRTILAASAALAVLALAAPSHAQVVRGGFENALGGVTAGRAYDVTGPLGGRAVGEGGVITNGDGDGVAGSRSCGRVYVGVGCQRAATTWDSDGNVTRESERIFESRFGGYGQSSGSLTRDSDGDWNGSRSGEYTIGNRTFSGNTTYESGDGFDRSITCSGSGCR